MIKSTKLLLNALFRFGSYQSNYGQAGLIKFNLTQGDYQVILKTHWEDNTTVNSTSDDLEFSEDGNVCSLQCNSIGQHIIEVSIPEYYSYGGIINGSMEHQNSNVDAKLYGDVDVLVSKDFQTNKIKANKANIKAQSINVLKYLESQSLNIAAEQDINIKKLAISRNANISTKIGSITIGSVYNQPSEHLQLPMQPLNDDQLIEYIKQTAYLSILANQSKFIKIGQYHGGLVADVNSKSLSIRMISNGLIQINNQGTSEIGIGQNTQGTIYSDKLNLNLMQQANVNINHNGKPIHEVTKNGYTIYAHCEELTIRQVDNIFGF